jgi:exo-poly-alpha-galacturonosidase
MTKVAVGEILLKILNDYLKKLNLQKIDYCLYCNKSSIQVVRSILGGNYYMKRAKRLSLVLVVLLMVCQVYGLGGDMPKAYAATVLPPQNLRVPALAYDEKSIVLVWEKPESYSNIVNYNVYMNGKLVGNANESNHSLAKTNIDNFYRDASNSAAQKITMHNYTATNLKANTAYTFTVRAVDKDGKESPDSIRVKQSTTAIPKMFNIVDYGAVGDGVTSNTKAIQAAIDACTPGGKVLIPAGIFKTGAIWLKGDMTFEIGKGATLLATENADEYPYHYLLYDYSTDERFFSLINAHTYDYGSIKNIRIVGEGTIDGNGWIQDGFDKEDSSLPVYLPAKNSSKDNVLDPNHALNIGILAKTSIEKAMAMNKMNFKAVYPRRPSMITLRGVTNVYYGGFTAVNPANHTLINLNCNNVTVNGVIMKTYDANNGDGIEFAHGDGLTVFNTFFDTGDDCMNFAAGQGAAGQKEESTKNAWIFNNYFRQGHGAIVTGSHTAAWTENILAEDNVINHTDTGLRSKTNNATGGGARNILFRDNALKDIKLQAFIFTSAYSDPNAVVEFEPASAPGRFKDITIKNCTVDTTGAPAIEVAGVSNGFHENINFENVKFYNVKPTKIDYMKNSSFSKVTFDNKTPNPWVITNSIGLSFDKDTTATPVTTDASVGPVWSDKSTLLADAIEENSVTLKWTGAKDNVAVAAYRIWNENSVVATVPGNTSIHKVTGLAPALSYDFKVEASDATGNWTVSGPNLKVVTDGVKENVPPVVPGGKEIVKAVNVGTTWVNIAWKPATDSHGIKQYIIYESDKRVAIVVGNTSAYNVTGLVPGTRYLFNVKAVDVSGNETIYGLTLEVNTKPGYDTGAPKWPADSKITSSNVTDTSVTLNWSMAVDDKQTVGYRVFQDGKPIKTDAEFTLINTAYTVKGNVFTVTGLAPNTTYTFKVEAGDTAGKWTGTGPSIRVTTKK